MPFFPFRFHLLEFRKFRYFIKEQLLCYFNIWLLTSSSYDSLRLCFLSLFLHPYSVHRLDGSYLMKQHLIFVSCLAIQFMSPWVSTAYYCEESISMLRELSSMNPNVSQILKSDFFCYVNIEQLTQTWPFLVFHMFGFLILIF